jgi:hypothetical protein
VPESTCRIPPDVGAYSFNFTAVPHASQLVANAAIVPAGSNGAITIYVTDETAALFNVNGYFAP